jgi:hypothetical protein
MLRRQKSCNFSTFLQFIKYTLVLYQFINFLYLPPIQWRSSSSMSMSRFDDLSMCPLFVFSVNDNVFTFLHPKHGLEYKYIINYPQVKRSYMNYEICCSKDGWLLLVGVNKSFQFFFNPFTEEDLPLPFEHKRIKNIRCFGMSHSPTSSDCVTVELDYGSSAITTAAHVHFLSEGVGDRISFKD